MQIFDRVEAESVERRNWHLWLLAISFIFILSFGLALFMLPTVFESEATSSPILRKAFYGFCTLTLLFNIYLLERQITIRRLSTERKRAEEALAHSLVEKDGLLTEVAERGAELETLLKLATLLSSPRPMEELLHIMARESAQALQGDAGAVFLLDLEKDVYHVQGNYGLSLASLSMATLPRSLLDDYIAEHRTESTLYGLPDTFPPLAEWCRQEGLCGLLYTLMQQDGSIGCLAIYTRDRNRRFTEREVNLARGIAQQAAPALARAQLDAQLQEAFEQLKIAQQQVIRQERLRALGEMASGIAHDLMNALSPVVGFSELLLRRSQLAERERKYLQGIHTAATDAASIVGRLREFYRPPEQVEVLTPIDVNTLFQEVVRLTEPCWRNMAITRGVNVEVQTELDSALPRVMGDASQLREALTNLIFNSVAALPQGGTITLRTRAEDDLVTLEVQDTGVGMSEAVRQRCIEPFFTTKGEEGTGLGLSMVYGIVKRLNGELQLESEEGQGSTFRIRLHVAPEGVREEVKFRSEEVQSLRVLCVDDDPRQLDVLEVLLFEQGHKVERAESGQEALDKFDPEKFDVVITDLGMPGIGGREVAQQIKKRSPSTPVLLLTGWQQKLAAEQALPPEVDIVLHKPPTMEVLHAALRKNALRSSS